MDFKCSRRHHFRSNGGLKIKFKMPSGKLSSAKKLSKSFSGTSKKVGPRFYLEFFTLDVEGAEYAISQLINFVVSKSKS